MDSVLKALSRLEDFTEEKMIWFMFSKELSFLPRSTWIA